MSGLMRDLLIVESATTTRNETGELEKQWAETFRCMAYKKKQAQLSGDVHAHESFIGQTASFLTWNYKEISYDNRIRWDGRLWEIRLLERREAEMTITLKRLDE